MKEITVGVVIILISLLGCFSNWLNWRYLNNRINYFLYYFGAFIHETSHALVALLTGAKVVEYKVFVKQPHVTYVNSKIPVIGNLLISIAPIFGGMIIIYFLNKYFFLNNYAIPQFYNFEFFIQDFLKFVKQFDLLKWRNLIAIFLFFNMGAMIGPSLQDLKNVWFLIIILLFISWPFFTKLGMLAVSLILINIILQLVLITISSLIKFIRK